MGSVLPVQKKMSLLTYSRSSVVDRMYQTEVDQHI